MNRNVLDGKWPQLKGRVTARWNRLSEREVAETQGNLGSLIHRIQKAYGLTREDAERELDQFLRSYFRHEPCKTPE